MDFSFLPLYSESFCAESLQQRRVIEVTDTERDLDEPEGG